MKIDGRTIAADILEAVKKEVKFLPKTPRLMVFSCAPNFETVKYLNLKKKKAAECGIELTVVEVDSESSEPEITLAIQQAHEVADGIIVQLPFPNRISVDDLVMAVSPSFDVDVLSYDGSGDDILPPVVGAIAEIADRNGIVWPGKKVVVVGHGRLVGAPAALYARTKGAEVAVLTKADGDIAAETLTADILILGAGVPGLITSDMIKDGAVIFDAGTSEMNGALAGDADPLIAEKASLYTPVPGGIGPITITILLRNLVRLTKHRIAMATKS